MLRLSNFSKSNLPKPFPKGKIPSPISSSQASKMQKVIRYNKALSFYYWQVP
jgi:hypothetical protein